MTAANLLVDQAVAPLTAVPWRRDRYPRSDRCCSRTGRWVRARTPWPRPATATCPHGRADQRSGAVTEAVQLRLPWSHPLSLRSLVLIRESAEWTNAVPLPGRRALCTCRSGRTG
jgi:hypothetical protein